jgi:cation diffusion facilitator family transporter
VHEGSRRAIVAAFLANLGIAAAKLVAFAFTGAASMLAEAVHSLADTGNQALLILGAARARRAASPEHPFGYGRERYFWSFVVALVLFSMGSLFAIYEGVEKLLHPHALASVPWAFAVLAIAIALEGSSLRTALREARSMREGDSLLRFVRRAKSPELPIVLLEDLGALVGLAFALAGIALAVATGDARFDALGSIAIGCLLGAIALVLAAEMKSLLIGEAASPAVEARIRSALADGPDVRGVIHLRTLHLGPDELLVAAKLEFAGHLDVPGLARAIDAVEARVRAAVAEARLVYIEPDVRRAVGAATGSGSPAPPPAPRAPL